MSDFSLTLVVNLGLLVGLLTLLWGVSLRLRDAGIIDPCWGLGFVLVAWLSFVLNHPTSWRACLISTLTTLWGLRLSFYLLKRSLGQGEDRRYAAMRLHHGPRFWWVSLFTVFLLQAVVLWFIAWPLQAACVLKSQKSLGLLDWLGVALWLIGFLFEAIGDWQLVKFKSAPENAGKVLDLGLWRFTRHPNYFGESCVWWGIYLIVIGTGAWWTIGSPLLMTFLLLYISGVSLLEQTIVDRRPEYAAYQLRTSAFFPWPPLNDSRNKNRESG